MNSGYWRYLRRIAKGTEDVVLAEHIPASWWHPQGRRKMVQRIEARGMPWLKGWLFFTLTVDPKLFDSPEDAYETAKDRIRRVIHGLRERGYEIRRYASKLELQGNEYPHWHLLVDTRARIPDAEVRELWGYGICQVKRIRPQKWQYLFKYVVKFSQDVPEWVLNYKKRIRVFQTSVGFFDKPAPLGVGEKRKIADVLPFLILLLRQVIAIREAAEDMRKKKAAPDDRAESSEPETLAQKFHRWARTAQVRMRRAIQHVGTVTLQRSFHEIILEHVASGRRVIDWFHIPLSNIELRKCIQT